MLRLRGAQVMTGWLVSPYALRLHSGPPLGLTLRLMNNTNLVRFLPALILVAGASAWLGARASATAPASRANDALEQAMEEIQRAVKALGKGITAETQATALEELSKLEQALLTAKSQVPDSAAGIDEKKRAAFVAEFRSTLCEALELACDAEIATANGKFKDAKNLLEGKLGALKSAGHDKFKKEDGGGEKRGK